MDGNTCQQPRDHEENPKGIGEMYKVMDDMCNEARETGRAEGHINNMIESARSLKARLGLSDQQAREFPEHFQRRSGEDRPEHIALHRPLFLPIIDFKRTSTRPHRRAV